MSSSGCVRRNDVLRPHSHNIHTSDIANKYAWKSLRRKDIAVERHTPSSSSNLIRILEDRIYTVSYRMIIMFYEIDHHTETMGGI